MSLAMFAAPVDENNEHQINNNDNNIMNKKRRTHNRTQKVNSTENFTTNKVNSILNEIYSNMGEDGEDVDTFNPPPKSSSSGVEKTMMPPQSAEMASPQYSSNDLMNRTLGRTPQPSYDGNDNLDLNDYKNYGSDAANDKYYKQLIPGYESQKRNANRPYHNGGNETSHQQQQQQQPDVLVQKLNYMISLLEEQQDERTDNVTEEVILYSFLGIFIIFIADSFVRIGKYVR
tara:strand:- start:1193 stop:1885 length:693 start_codon:yes stop_codon:yes gene_type:complete